MEQDGGPSTPKGWSGLGAIAALRELNARCIEVMAAISRTENPLERSMIYRESELWSRMDQRACERAGSCPVLLLNLKFERLEWWKRVCAGKGGPSPPDAPCTLFGECQGEPLLREILTEVWRLGGSLPDAANLAFGMAPGVSTELSKLSVLTIHHMATTFDEYLRPRWEQNAAFWRQLLEAAVGIDDEALSNVHLFCLQLLGSDLELQRSSDQR
jgi:hypothetical protein